jgi:hypothetical protein
MLASASRIVTPASIAAAAAVMWTCAVAAPARGDPSYFLITRGDVPTTRTSDTSGGLQWTPSALAVRPDGVMAFATAPRGEVFWVQGGHLLRITLPADGSDERDVHVAFAPDGTLVFSICGRHGRGGSVWRVAPGRPRTLVAGRAGRQGWSGDRGPATAAALDCP